MKKKLFSFVILASIALFHMDVFAVSTSSINAFSQPSESNSSLVNQLFHQALNSINKFFSHSNVQTASVSQTDMQAAITKFYVSSNANIANKTSNQNSAFFDKNDATSRAFVSSDGKPSPDSERAFC